MWILVQSTKKSKKTTFFCIKNNLTVAIIINVLSLSESYLMELKFIKNIQFTKLIKVDGKLKEFNFRKPNGKQEGLFTVDVLDDRGNRIIFNMEKTEQHWKIVTAELPIWVIGSENNLDELISEEFVGS